MNKVYLAIVTLPLIFTDLHSQTDNGSSICWEESYKLSWADFQGVVPASNSSDNIYAITSCNIVISIQTIGNEFDFKVENKFLKHKSWTTGDLRNFLDHEQLHFDVAELYTRKIRNSIDSLNSIGCDSLALYKNEFDRLFSLKDRLNRLYDEETSYGNDSTAQSRWKHFVMCELRKLDPFASDSESCTR
jgi:hypothetical protein